MHMVTAICSITEIYQIFQTFLMSAPRNCQVTYVKLLGVGARIRSFVNTRLLDIGVVKDEQLSFEWLPSRYTQARPVRRPQPRLSPSKEVT